MEECAQSTKNSEKFFVLKSFHIFKYNINRVWYIVSNPTKLIKSLSEFMDKLEYYDILNKNDLNKKDEKFRVGSKFNFRWKGLVSVKSETKIMIEEEFFKQISFEAISQSPFSIKYQVFFSLFWNSVEENTLMIHKILVYDENNYMFKNDQEANRKERIKMYNKMEDLLYNDLNSLTQEEGIYLNIGIDTLFDIVSDWRKFKYYVPQICLDIEYTGNPRKIGTEIKIINNGMKNGFTKLKVIDSYYIASSKKHSNSYYLQENKSSSWSNIYFSGKNRLENVYYTVNNSGNASCEKSINKSKDIKHLRSLNKIDNNSTNSIINKCSNEDDSINYLKKKGANKSDRKYEENKFSDIENKEKINFVKITNENHPNAVIIEKEKEKKFIITNNKKEEKEHDLIEHSINGKILDYFQKLNNQFYIEVNNNNNCQNNSCFSNEFRYVIECYDGLPKCPLQILSFRLTKIDKGNTYLTFKHQFKQPVKYELIKSIAQEKKNILFNLKTALFKEKENEDSSNNKQTNSN